MQAHCNRRGTQLVAHTIESNPSSPAAVARLGDRPTEPDLTLPKPAMPSDSRSPGPARQVVAALADSSPGATLIARLTQSQRIARILASAPSLAACGFDFERAGICELRDLQLRVIARSPNELTKLRQSQPAIQAILAAHGFEGIQIRLCVQPVQPMYRVDGSSEYTRKAATHQLDASIRQNLDIQALSVFSEKLVNTIQNQRIRASAEKMYRAAQARLAQMRDK